MINRVIGGLEGCQAYIDDIIVYSDNWDQYVKQLREFMCRLREAKLTVNLVKTEFCHARVEFLGHIVEQGWISPVTAKVEAITKFPVPADQRQLMRFLGMAGYYRKFCHNFSTIAEPLTALLRKGKRFTWSAVCQSAFEKIWSILLLSLSSWHLISRNNLSYLWMLAMWVLVQCCFRRTPMVWIIQYVIIRRS